MRNIYNLKRKQDILSYWDGTQYHNLQNKLKTMAEQEKRLTLGDLKKLMLITTEREKM